MVQLETIMNHTPRSRRELLYLSQAQGVLDHTMVSPTLSCPRSNVPLIIAYKVHDKFTEGDCKVVSSDKIVFCVQRYYLQASSAILRTALELSRDDTEDIVFVMDDTEIEGSTIIERYFQSFLGISTSFTSSDHDKVHSCLRFARKWDCAPFSSQIFNSLKSSMVGPRPPHIDPQQIFFMGAELDDADLCAAAIRCPWHQPLEPNAPESDWKADHFALFSTGWDYDVFMRYPKYSWALMAAVRTYQRSNYLDEHPKDKDWQMMAQQFLLALEFGRAYVIRVGCT
ncbi:hypothetical protein TREMEDRAFT_62947 [Tremella mesenterica DSM 1558]|uniref:uncharacterized protein n=1 Tax=Tremella mesenterica (strain ATCC 24925 / CBS 8224 / DSM 1558 / NBRC 9311 / NRRL Y-6157 / RJB 2259-6 / UBC 559-6) TaxID=578456 RepID=UPI0003F49001|nr:uncharacterized protein TREMEDRAFT_62947 [Tremella mesenterica DSM 1558]EIW69217.1 hypothetical protein TREMEDRAFT_62947 [Tremella mesenterica DSM 1558]